MVSKESKNGPKENPKPDETDDLGSEKDKGPENSSREEPLQSNSSAQVAVFVFLSSSLSFRLRIHLCLCNRDFRKGAQNGALVQGKTLCTQPS